MCCEDLQSIEFQCLPEYSNKSDLCVLVLFVLLMWEQSVENCVCILHNLSYQLVKEAPDHFNELPDPDEKPNKSKNKNSLFSPKSTMTQKVRAFPDKMTSMHDVLDAGQGLVNLKIKLIIFQTRMTFCILWNTK